MSVELIEKFDRLIRRDPACRGLIGSEAEYGALCVGHLAAAASHLAEFGSQVSIVTGFYIPHGDPPAAETDGPPGSLMLAMALHTLGIETTVLTDENCTPAVLAAAEAVEFPASRVVSYRHGSDSWIEQFFSEGPGRELTHLISIERVGPSHTPESLAMQERPTEVPLNDFRMHASPENHGCCHNMRGQVIDEQTADIHRIFEQLQRFRPEARTIGIGDGANEIGMGTIPWEELHRRLEGEYAGCIPCRIPTDWNIIAGTSNWGGYALAAAVLLLKDRTAVLKDWDQHHQQRALEHLVEHGPAVDGVTGRREATVDGLPFLTYIQPWLGIRRLLGYDD